MKKIKISILLVLILMVALSFGAMSKVFAADSTINPDEYVEVETEDDNGSKEENKTTTNTTNTINDDKKTENTTNTTEENKENKTNNTEKNNTTNKTNTATSNVPQTGEFVNAKVIVIVAIATLGLIIAFAKQILELVMG